MTVMTTLAQVQAMLPGSTALTVMLVVFLGLSWILAKKLEQVAERR